MRCGALQKKRLRCQFDMKAHERRLFRLVCLLPLVCGCLVAEPVADAGAVFSGGDAGSVDAGVDAGSPGIDAGGFARLGVYVVGIDGGSFRALLDPGTRGLTHVRQLPGTDWLTATRYTVDLDGNGLAMELEYGAAFYGGTEIVVFQRSQPSVMTRVAGGLAGTLCANSSWTEDGMLILTQQDQPTGGTRLKRVRFSSLPNVASVDVVPTPAELMLPVDPHQVGPSDGGGVVVFSAKFQHPTGFMAPVWRMSSAGAESLSGVSVVGCPICPANGGCCAFATLEAVLGANDPRMNHAGTEVSFMQQSPHIFVNLPPLLHPYRQVRKVEGQAQTDLSTPGIAGTTSETFIEWREDDQQGVYWSMEVVGATLRHSLSVMKPDGTARQQIPIPRELCPSHPSYLSDSEIVFSAFRCSGPSCTCDPMAL